MSVHEAAATIARLGATPHSITADSRQVLPGRAFAAYRGHRADVLG